MPEGQQMVLPIGGSSGLVLFFHILSLLIYPIILTLIVRTSGHNILSKCMDNWDTRDTRITVLAETTLGFLLFSTLMLGLASLGWYTLTGLLSVLVLLAIVGWKGWINTYNLIKNTRCSFENHEGGRSL